MINAEEFAVKMKEIDEKYGNDREAKHSLMDDLMCEVLKQQGFEKGVEVFDNADIWYN